MGDNVQVNDKIFRLAHEIAEAMGQSNVRITEFSVIDVTTYSTIGKRFLVDLTVVSKDDPTGTITPPDISPLYHGC